jgi:hypothetical protein
MLILLIVSWPPGLELPVLFYSGYELPIKMFWAEYMYLVGRDMQTELVGHEAGDSTVVFPRFPEFVLLQRREEGMHATLALPTRPERLSNSGQIKLVRGV